jgi:DNA-binding response OmpR family regulator
MLEDNGIEVSSGISLMDCKSKMRNLAPDLIILDWTEDGKDLMELLRERKKDPNTVKTPLIILSQKMEQKQLVELAPYNVKKVFNKPIKIDAFFAALSEILSVPFKIDEKPGIMELHVNEGIIFIEIAQGLNRDKLNLLRFKVSELIDLYNIRIPKIIVLLSDITLNLSDTPRLQKLMITILDAARAKQNNVKILTNNVFVRDYIKGQKDFSNIAVVSDLQKAIDGLMARSGDFGWRPEESKDRRERLGKMILHAKTGEKDEDMDFKFEAEEKKNHLELIKDSVQNLRIAIIDDDYVTRELIKNTFEKTNSFFYSFSDGEEFLEVTDNDTFDIAFLDLEMPKMNGIEVLRVLQTRNIRYPIVVMSAVNQRETMLQVIQMGIKSYFIKPLNPEEIFMKTIEILKANF